MSVLRPVEPRDHGALADLRGDRSLQHLLLAHPEGDGHADVAAWIARREAAGFFAVISDGAAQAAGFVQIAAIHRRNRLGWLGIALAPQARRRGLGRRAVTALETVATGTLGLRKLLLEVRADNAPARSLYSGLGYREVGVMAAHYDDGARLHDVVVMERLLGPAP